MLSTYPLIQLDMCHTNSFSLLVRCPCVARNIKMYLHENFILWEKRMSEGMPYLQMRRGVWVSFCKIAIVSFPSVGYKLDGLYCRMAGTPSSRTLFFIRVEICECHCPPHTHTHFPTPKEQGDTSILILIYRLASLSNIHTHTLPGTEGVGWHIDLDNNLSTPLSNTHTHTLASCASVPTAHTLDTSFSPSPPNNDSRRVTTRSNHNLSIGFSLKHCVSVPRSVAPSICILLARTQLQ